MRNIYKDIFNKLNNKKLDKQIILENDYFSLVKISLNIPINNYEYYVIRVWKNNLAEIFEYKLINHDPKKIYLMSEGYEIANSEEKNIMNYELLKLL